MPDDPIALSKVDRDEAACQPPFPVGKCRSCPAAVIWTISEAGRSTPVDAEPHPAGMIALSWVGGRVQSRVVKPDRLRFGRTDLRRNHFATCPDSTRWRRPRPRQRGALMKRRPWAIRRGITRTVLLTDRYAIKVPSLRSHRGGVRGRIWSLCRGWLANEAERVWWTGCGERPRVACRPGCPRRGH